MAESLVGMERLPEPMRGNIQQYAGLLKDLAGEAAESLTLFGAIAAGVFDATRHTVRSVLVVEAVDLHMLRRLAEHGKNLGKSHISAPLVMTAKYIKESLDTFPLELIEIKQKHITLFGKDHFNDLTFEEPHVRLQCERELKVLCLTLRQGLLAAAGRDKPLAELQLKVGEDLMRTLRGMLWIKGRQEAQPASQVLIEIENLAQRKLPGVRAAVDATAEHGWPQFEKLYDDVSGLGDLVDAW